VNPELFDIGLNLSHDSFDADRDEVLKQAHRAGVTRMLLTGSDLVHSNKALALVRKHPDELRCTAGIHPHHAQALSDEEAHALRLLLDRTEVLAVGEAGLDFFRNLSPAADQERVFRLQLLWAVETDKPIFMHERDAHDAFSAILSDYAPRLTGGVVHCFTGDTSQMQRYVELGMHIGITGWVCDERRGKTLCEAVPHIPLERLLIETDAPYLIPRTLKPKPKSHRNEPRYLPAVLARIAEFRSETVEELAAATTANAISLFKWR